MKHPSDSSQFLKEPRPARRKPRSRSIAVRFTIDEADRIRTAAAQKGQNVREWMRERLLAPAVANVDNLLLMEQVAQHMLLQQSMRALLSGVGMSAARFDATLAEIRDRKHAEAERLRINYGQSGHREEDIKACPGDRPAEAVSVRSMTLWNA